jgi:D-alanyl-D-alanine carboxypeptidase/D-alanyl-D-alanine-endopeptidase (penicillin-binding protein 4)
MYDGSGLSPANRVNAAFFVGLLDYMSKSKSKDTYFNSLAVAGVDGTLKSFLSNTPLTGKVRAKSGSFDGVLSYCGQLEKRGKTYNFCIITNAFTCPTSEVKRAIERLLVDF